MSTTFDLIISAPQLLALPQDKVCVLDCSFDLSAPDAARQAVAASHMTGAHFADLDLHLSAHGDIPAVNAGRHPLPTREWFASQLGLWGITPTTQVVVYDRNGNNFCGRAWWMLKWCGHQAVAILDGGLAAWQAAGGAVSNTTEAPTPAQDYPLTEPLVQLRDTATILSNLQHQPHTQCIVDARSAPRFRGETEPLDPVAGHIPGARNHPFNTNFDSNGLFKSAQQLHALWAQTLDGQDPATVVMQCGSGVSAVPNVVAMALAGLPMPALYAGSWSEWSRTPGTPKQTIHGLV